MKYDLRGKNVVLTGGSRGIGKAVALELAAEGAVIAIASRDEARLRDTGEMVEKAGGSCITLPCDITDDHSVHQMVESAVQALGRIDVFMNIAGITLEKPLMKANPDDFRNLMETNLLGTFRCARAAIPFLMETKGVLVNVASIIARTPFPYLGVYACSKWAVAAFSSTLRQELSATGIRVLTVYPTIVKTDMVAEEPVLANSPSQSPQQCARAIIRAIKNGKIESDTAYMPKLLSTVFFLSPRLGEMITRLFLPREYRGMQ